MPRPASITESFSHSRVGRAALHFACLLRRRHVRWHCAGIVRELFGHRSCPRSVDHERKAAGWVFAVGLSLAAPGMAADSGAGLRPVLAGVSPANRNWGETPRIAGGTPAPLSALAGSSFELLSAAPVDGTGIHLHQVAAPLRPILPNLRLADAPPFGQTASFSRAQLTEMLRRVAPELATNAWTGAAQIRVSRRARALGEAELRDLLTMTLQGDVVKDRGELELRFSRPWSPVNVPDEPIALKLLDVPATGVTPNFIARFEITTGTERVGPWQVVLQARLWKEVLVAKSTLKRGGPLAGAEVTTEKRDVISMREPLEAAALSDSSLDLYEGVPAGQTVLARHVRARAIVQRGQFVDALMRDGTLSISLKVEALGDGATGQTIRVRNPKTKREFYAKIKDEQTVLLAL